MLEQKARERGLARDVLLAWRQRRTRPIVDRFRRWLAEIEPTLLPSDPLGKVVRYYLRHFDALTAFVDDAGLAIDNNQSERLFKNHAKSRLNSLFAGSIEGAHRYATIAGVVASAQREGLDVFAYLTWAFERRGTHRDWFGLAASQLTPGGAGRGGSRAGGADDLAARVVRLQDQVPGLRRREALGMARFEVATT